MRLATKNIWRFVGALAVGIFLLLTMHVAVSSDVNSDSRRYYHVDYIEIGEVNGGEPRAVCGVLVADGGQPLSISCTDGRRRF